MRRIAVVGLLLLSMFLLMAGCATGGGTAGGEGGFDTKYCAECQTYHPADHPHSQAAEGLEAE